MNRTTDEPALVKPAPRSVLLAEIDAVSRKVAQFMLERLEHHVDVVSTGPEVALAVLRQHYDVVLLDDRMRDQDGRSAVQVIRDGDPVGGQPVIVAVSAGEPGQDATTAPAGADLVLLKPFRLGQLSALLDRASAGAPSAVNGHGTPEAIDGQAAIRARLATMAGPDPAEDREMFSDVLRSLARRGPVDVELIHEAARRSSHREVEDRAHSLRGAVVTLGGSGLGGHLEEVESRGRAQEAVPEALLALVRTEQSRFREDLLVVAAELDRA